MRPVKNFNKIEGEIIPILPTPIDDTKLIVKEIIEMGMVTSFKLSDPALNSPYHDLVMVRIDWDKKQIAYRLYDKSSANRLAELSTPIVEEDWKTNKVFLSKIHRDLVGSELLTQYIADRDIPF